MRYINMDKLTDEIREDLSLKEQMGSKRDIK